MQKNIKVIPQKPKLVKPVNVAAYARVSTGKDAMLHSLSQQVSAYSKMIQSHPGWQYVGVYADEAITGTKEERSDFQRMLADCRAGRIDLIITKSISRFARNTVTVLESVRELKALGVDIFFEEQNIHSLSSEGELMLTILASYAQEESRSVSENQKWRIRKSFENGEIMCWRFMYGYCIQNGVITIDEEKAPIVREIFRRVIDGETLSAIARDLNERGIETFFGREWNNERIHALVANEKYAGNAMLQKSFVNNHLEKKKLPNRGELPKYYAEETHPAIIDAETFAAAQEALQHIAEKIRGRSLPHETSFSRKIVCGQCGQSFKRVTSDRCVGWNCRTFQEQGVAFCKAKKVPESVLEQLSAEVLETEIFDTEAFLTSVDHIEVYPDNRIDFILRNGRRVTKHWTDRSRRESWTPEMKQAARERAKRQWEDKKCPK